MSRKINILPGIYNLMPRLAGILFFATFSGCISQRMDIHNPYESVNWSDHIQYKANFHTHTTMSDGLINPHAVVDHYKELGYGILAITDHNGVTWPWTGFAELASVRAAASGTTTVKFDYENRDPVNLQMIDIQANELSDHHHMGSFFNDHNGTDTDVKSLQATSAKSGIVMFYHPGRHNYQVSWYVDLYRQYDHLIGQEVFNQGDRHPLDRLKWDEILAALMPDRPVWGYSNDDMHTIRHIGRNWNLMILPELSPGQVRHAMERGISFFVYAPQGHDGPSPPAIKSIMVNHVEGTIEIIAAGYDSINWIAGGTLLHTGSSINLHEFEGPLNYVRAELHGPGETITGTQPFGIRRR
jgi:hypothetical protein